MNTQTYPKYLLSNQIDVFKNISSLTKILITFCLLSFLPHWVNAQSQAVTLNLIPDKIPNSGEEFCVDVTTDDWTSIINIENFFSWNPDVIEFVDVTNLTTQLPGLDDADFDRAGVSAGVLYFNWDGIPCGEDGSTLDDDTRIFSICFRAKASYGDNTEIYIPRDTMLVEGGEFLPRAVKQRSCNAPEQNAGLTHSNGIISIEVRPLQVIAETKPAFEGEQVCVAYSVSGFDDIFQMQFSINWDPAKLRYSNIVDTENLEALGPTNFGTPDNSEGVEPGQLTMSWSTPNILQDQGETVPDGESIFEVCFDVLSGCETDAPITFSNTPTEIDLGNRRRGDGLASFMIDGAIEIGDCTPTGLNLTADCSVPFDTQIDSLKIGDLICVSVSSDNFEDITSVSHGIEWNENILTFREIRNQFPLIEVADPFNTENVDNGIIGFEFDAPGGSANIPAGVLYEICFEVTGLGGDSPFNFIGNPSLTARKVGDDRFGINPSSCRIEIPQPPGVTLILSEAEGRPGDIVCLDVTVNNFNEVETASFGFGWDNRTVVFSSATINDKLAGARPSDNPSFFGINYNGAPVTLEDGEVIATICLEVVGEPLECDTEIGIPVSGLGGFTNEITTSSSNGEDIGIERQLGEVCVLFPEGFILDLGFNFGFILDTVCVPVSVSSFDNITKAQFALTWDPNLFYAGVQNLTTELENFTEDNFITSSSPVGLLEIDWTNLAGESLEDGTVLFELCFVPIDGAGRCSPIELSDSPEPDITVLSGANADVVAPTPGEICIEDRIVVTADVTDVTCPGTNDGEINLIVSGGRGPYLINWTLDPQPPQFGQRAVNLSEGMKILTISDNTLPEALIYQDTFIVGISEDVPLADAGEDVMLNCTDGAQFAILDGARLDGDFRYRWAALSEGGTITGPDTIPKVTVLSPGEYLYEVTNRETGCFSRDTVSVTANLPVADAGFSFDYNCDTDVLRLNGSLSSSGDDFAYTWEAFDGGSIVADNENAVSPQVNAPGTYVLTVRNVVEGCVATDTTVVNDIRDIVPVDAGPDQTIGCVGDSIILNPIAEPGTFDYRWLDENGELLTLGSTLSTPQDGMFILVARDETTGCTGQDTIMVERVIQDLDVRAEALSMIDCLKDTASVLVSVPEEFLPVTIQWEPLDGGVVVQDGDLFEAKVGSAGMYRATVTNPDNNCQNFADVEVSELKSDPLVEAGESVTLDCTEPSIVLDGVGTSTGDNFTYRWLRGDTSEVSNDLQFEARLAGTYYLEVTDETNGCFAKDSVTVNVNDDIPTININPPSGVIDCNNDQVIINADQPSVANFDLEWVARGDTGNIISSLTDLSITVDAPGTYQVMVLDTDNNCVGFNEVLVDGNLTPPDVDAGEDQFITCESAETVISGNAVSIDTPDGTVNYTWQALEGGSITGPTNLDSAIVNQPGLFALMAMDLSNGCIGFDTVQVEADTMLPIVVFDLLEGSLGCGDTLVAISAINSTLVNPVTIEWTGLDDNDDAINNTNNRLIVEVGEPGRYELTITNDDSGCQSSAQITVEEDTPEINIIFADDSPTEGCPDPGVLLDATQSQVGGAAFQTRWQALDVGNSVEADSLNPLLATANGVGDYELFVTLGGTCIARDTVTVLPSAGFPEAIVVTDQIEIECGETATLDGTGSSVGDDFSYLWVNSETGTLIDNGNQIVASTQQQGTYTLLVLNTVSNCVDSAQVIVNLNTDGLPSADAGVDETICEAETILAATDPGALATGVWTTNTGATIESPNLNTSIVTGLQPGENLFTWTLSAEGCIDYESADVIVTVGQAPNASSDNFTMSARTRDTTLNLLENDNLDGISDFSITILSEPTLGALSELDPSKGVVNYSFNTGTAAGTDLFTYLICNNACENLCDTATVNITIEEVVFQKTDIDQPNGITPNGDGMNDELIFDVIDDFPGNFPDNHMIIFNRWGDIVFEARPYENNWAGTNNTGQDLPAGTYYYILRLDLAEGVILRGDVTIVR